MDIFWVASRLVGPPAALVFTLKFPGYYIAGTLLHLALVFACVRSRSVRRRVVWGVCALFVWVVWSYLVTEVMLLV